MIENPFTFMDDGALESNLINLCRTERECGADIILHLLLVKERRLYAIAGHDSLFAYCKDRLGFSRSSAYRRKTIVDHAENFPSLIDRLRDGRLHLCAAACIAPHLEHETAELLMDAVAGLSHREVEHYLIRNWRPQRPSPPTTPNAAPAAANPLLVSPEPYGSKSLPPDSPNVGILTDRTIVRPLSADSNRVNITLSDQTLEKLKRARELQRGKSDDEILQKSLDGLLDKLAPERRVQRREARIAAAARKTKVDDCGTGAKTRPRPSSRAGRLADRDRVLVDAGNQCSYRASDGTECRARSFIEIDHVRPWALGGTSDRENLRPLCRTHNLMMAQRTFGPWPSRRHEPNDGVDSTKD